MYDDDYRRDDYRRDEWRRDQIRQDYIRDDYIRQDYIDQDHRDYMNQLEDDRYRRQKEAERHEKFTDAVNAGASPYPRTSSPRSSGSEHPRSDSL